MASADPSKPIVLHIGDPIIYNPDLYAELSSKFTVIRPSLEERQRDAFSAHLKAKKWGDFSAILRPFWDSGGEMGRWDKELVPLLPASVKLFASAGAGYDWADVDVLAAHGIIYCNSASAATESVADFALFGIISTFRNLPYCITSSQSPHTFATCHESAVRTAHNPRGHTLGIIGLGAIGHLIAKKASLAFGMKIVYFDIFRKSPEIEAALPALYVEDLPTLLRQSDCVVLATPSSPDGSKLITALTLAQFKPGARFVNIARGSLVDEAALVAALESGHLSAVMLDVHENEPSTNEALRKMALHGPTGGPNRGRANVMLTCHNAGGTLETHYAFERVSMENVLAVLEGKEPLSAVNAHLIAK